MYMDEGKMGCEAVNKMYICNRRRQSSKHNGRQKIHEIYFLLSFMEKHKHKHTHNPSPPRLTYTQTEETITSDLSVQNKNKTKNN